jgi:pimeloyl-ACP methyl ester carboxylesterase
MVLVGLLVAPAIVCAVIVYGLYVRDLAAIRARVQQGGHLAATPAGIVEYANQGEGRPALVIHGAGGGYDQGLLIAASLLGPGFRVIAPSRFGDLQTPVPKDTSPAAQAEAHAALLDWLGIDKVIVVGVSAGAPSAGWPPVSNTTSLASGTCSAMSPAACCPFSRRP